ncbi:unnamed protein product [Camellia sinensis]
MDRSALEEERKIDCCELSSSSGGNDVISSRDTPRSVTCTSHGLTSVIGRRREMEDAVTVELRNQQQQQQQQQQLKSPYYVNTTSFCDNGIDSSSLKGYSYVVAGQVSVWYVADSCTVQTIAISSSPLLIGTEITSNFSLSDVNKALEYGFEASWEFKTCKGCKKRASCFGDAVNVIAACSIAHYVLLLYSFKEQLQQHVCVHAMEVVMACWEIEQSLQSLTVFITMLMQMVLKHLGANVAGGRGFYLKDGVRLNQALINFGLDFVEKRGYTALQTPFFMRKDIMAKCAQLAQFDEELYKNGLDTKVEKSRKQLKERKNRTMKIRGVKKVRKLLILALGYTYTDQGWRCCKGWEEEIRCCGFCGYCMPEAKAKNGLTQQLSSYSYSVIFGFWFSFLAA